MLDKDRKHRLGHEKDVEDILDHPWFADLDIAKLLRKEIPAPFIPKVTAEADLQNFEEEITKSSLAETMIDKSKTAKVDAQKNVFADFGTIQD
jgi:hypothetical protein